RKTLSKVQLINPMYKKYLNLYAEFFQSKMFKIFVYSFCLWFLLSNPVVKAQESLTELIDSLAVAQNQMTSFELCLKIADELKYSDKTRAAHYLELARKKAENIDKE